MAKKNILVVEDDNIIGMEIKDRVENLGYHVAALLSRGEDAIVQVEKNLPDLILMDIRLKGEIDGIQATEKIRSNYDVPVVYLTAYADDNTLQRAKITEPFGYVIKPFEERDLASTIEMALYKHQIDKKLRENERWLATTLRSIGDGVIATDTKGRIEFMNPIAEQLTGWRQDDALEKELDTVFQIVDEFDDQPVENPLKKVLHDKKIKEPSDETILVSKDGSKIPILDTASPIMNEKGEITGAVLVFHNNTERKKSQEYLTLQSRHNELRANLWKIASDKSISEDELISRMLEFLGPAINVSRIGYNELYGNLLDEGKFKCILEWCEEGVSSTLNETLPAKLVNSLLKKNIVVVDQESVFELIPKVMHPIAKPVISAFVKKHNLEIVVIVPYYINKKLEGILTFDVCKDKKIKPKWTNEIKNIIIEAVDIVSSFIIQKRSEEALRVSEERFRTIFETIPDSIFIKDRFLTYTHVNPAMEELFERSAAELVSMEDDELYGVDSAKKQRNFDLKVLKGETIKTEDTHQFHSIPKTFDIVRVPMRDHQGKIAGLCGIARDITERKKSDEIQSVLYEISKAVNVTKDLHELFKSMQNILGRVIDTTNFYIALYNKERDIITLPYHVDKVDKFHEIPAGNTMTAYLIKMKKSIRILQPEIEKLAKQGKIELVGTMPKIWMGVPLKIGNNVVGVIAVQSYDNASLYTEEHLSVLEFVSGQIALAIELKKADEERVRLATAIRSAGDAILITDENASIQYVNPAFEKITGYTYDEVVTKNPKILKSGRQDDAFYDNLWVTISSGRMWTGHFINRKKDGEYYEEDASISPVVDESGKIINYVGVKRDVTDEYDMQMRLRQAEKMKAIGTLAGGIAHDFNNIIGAVIGYTELSMDDVTNPVTLRNLKQIIKASHRAKELVKQILLFSRQSAQERKPLEIALIVKEALKLLKASLPSTIEINHNIQAKSSLVFADPTQIHQIVLNLCTNAAHAMRDRNGILDVTLRDVEIDQESAKLYHELKPGKYVKMMVKDNGHGIDPEIIDRIFEPYFTTKKAGEGAGMGLALVHGIVKACKGEITVYSVKGQGATFNVFFPRIFAKTEKEQVVIKPLPRGTEKILYVDDEKNLVNVGKQMLERLGYSVTSTTSSREALNIFQNDPHGFDLVITDQTMPELTGADLAANILQLRDDIPIILCTGYSENVSKEKANQIGIKEYVMKPLFAEELANIIRKALDE